MAQLYILWLFFYSSYPVYSFSLLLPLVLSCEYIVLLALSFIANDTLQVLPIALRAAAYTPSRYVAIH